MACSSPMQAKRCLHTGKVTFVKSPLMHGFDLRTSFLDIKKRIESLGFESLVLPCGQCTLCKLDRARQTAVRCMHEAETWTQNCFLTLTYDDQHLKSKSLIRKDIQDFLKRLRFHHQGDDVVIFQNKIYRPIRYFYCGEYGEKRGRPHFHICLFNFNFEDRKLDRISYSGLPLYTSSDLEKLWPFGISKIGTMTFESAGYCARYALKKRTGKGSEAFYRKNNLLPEFNQSSLKPGLGYFWYKKYFSDLYPSDSVIVRGYETRVPRYYDKLLEREDPVFFQAVKDARRSKYSTISDVQTYAGLLAKEIYKEIDIKALSRDYEVA